MKLATQDRSDARVISMQGKIMSEVDTAELMDAVKASIYENKNKIVLDLGGVDWMNSTGLGMLIAARSLILEVKGQLRLASLNESVRSLMSLNKLDMIFEIHPDVTAAEASMKQF
jgi:anti-sigma B factor antagonist